MDFDSAIVAHTTWKNKLKAYFGEERWFSKSSGRAVGPEM